MDNVRPDRGLDWSNSRLAGHFDRSFLDACRLMRFALQCCNSLLSLAFFAGLH